MDFPDRLRGALDRWPGGSHRGFSKWLEERGVPGASYRQLARYLKGESEPSLEWIQEACEALNVSADWLVLGKEPTKPSGDSTGEDLREHEPLVKMLDRTVKERGHSWFEYGDLNILAEFCGRLLVFRPEKFGFPSWRTQWWGKRQKLQALHELPEEQVWSVIDELFPSLKADSPFIHIGELDFWGTAHSAFYASLSAAWANEMMIMVEKKKRSDL